MDQEEKKKLRFESETLQRLCINRKQENFDGLRSWDQVRAHKLITHRKAADEIEETLQTRIAESNEFLKVVLQFLSDCETQQQRYPYHNFEKFDATIQFFAKSERLKENPELSEIIYDQDLECSHLKYFYALDAGERDIMEIRTKIELEAVEVQNENGMTIEKCDEVVAAYNEEKKTTKLFQTESDLFHLQQEFLQQSISQTKTQQSFGGSVVELLLIVEKQEKEKLELVRSILEDYLLVSAQENEKKDDTLDSLLDILEKRTEYEIIDAFYSSEELISKETIKEIRKAESKQENEKIDLEIVKKFLMKITYHPFDSRNLILKEYRTYIKKGDDLENSYLVVTVDAFLHIYEYKHHFELLEAHSELCFKCNNSLGMKREAETNLIIIVKRWLLSPQPSDTVEVVFLNEDQREEFLEFVAKIIQ